MNIGVLTGGGDCPGLNAVIRAVVKRAIGSFNYNVSGIKFGWKGLIEGIYMPLDMNRVSGILDRGGTILGTSRTNPFKDEGRLKVLLENIKTAMFDALVVIGGEDTLGVAERLYREHSIPIVGIPKTIDNDISETDYSIGFWSSIHTAVEAIDRLRTTAESHNRVMIAEVMGRHAGWIAAYAGICSGADIVLIPEFEMSIDDIIDILNKRLKRGRDFTIIVIAEGTKLKEMDELLSKAKTDEFGHIYLGGIGSFLADEIEKRTGLDARSTILGYIQRGGQAIPFDRYLGTIFGISAVDLISRGNYGYMVALKGQEVVSVPLSRAIKQIKQVDDKLYNIARVFFG
ncbi:MAG: 6-phosphofructokinase [bacterium]